MTAFLIFVAGWAASMVFTGLVARRDRLRRAASRPIADRYVGHRTVFDDGWTF